MKPLSDEALLDDLSRRTFAFFWERSDSLRGITPDRWPTQSFASVAATGFALTAYPIGAHRGYVPREVAAERTLRTLEYFWSARQDSTAAGCIGYRGFFYHFLDQETGTRFRDVELSTVDTALFLAGALCCRSYFDGAGAAETRIRSLADSLVGRVDWTWATIRPPTIGHGWTPEHGHLAYDWRGYNEALLLYIVALGSPTHAVPEAAYESWVSGYKWGEFYGQEHLGFAPLFGHQYSQVWLDLRGLHDRATREKGIDYFESARRASLGQHAYAVSNPSGFEAYGPLEWGLSACDGPFDGRVSIAGREREFHTYWARGASFTEIQDDGTLCPSAMGASLVFAPEIVVPALQHMRAKYGDRIYGRYGFFDAYNPTLRDGVATHHGVVDSTLGWFDTDYLGIEQGPLLAMIENYRSEFVWNLMKKNEVIRRGLERAGFTGAWLGEGERRGP